MSKGSQPAGSTTTTQTPPSYMYPYIGTALGQASSLLGSYGPQYYPSQQTAGFSAPQQAAMSGITALAKNGTTAGNAGMNFDANLLNGNFSGPQATLAQMGQGGVTNPILNSMFQQAAGQVQNQLQSEYGNAGRNISASAPMMGQTLDKLATNIYGGAYAQDQANALAANQALGNEQQDALEMVPGLNNMQFGNLGQEMNVGGMVQNQAQNLINANMTKYNYYQLLPYQQLQQYEQYLSGVQPGSQQTNPYFNNPTANGLNTALGLQQLYNGMGNTGGYYSGSTLPALNSLDPPPNFSYMPIAQEDPSP